jgi:hypothetical protein
MVWNLALRYRSKGTLAFPDVSEALLSALVLDDLRAATPLNTKRVSGDGIAGLGLGEGYIPALGAVISVPSPVVLQPDERESEIIWNAAEVGSGAKGAVLYYVDVFDFRNADEMFDFEYVKAVASTDFGSVKERGLVLVRRSEVDIVDLSEAG